VKEAAKELGIETKGLAENKIMEALRAKYEALPEKQQGEFQKKFQTKMEKALEKYTTAQRELQEATVSPEQLMMQKRAEIEQKSTITGIAVSKDDVFVACPMIKSYGFAVWRVNRDFAEPKQIIDGLRGCCGQMDVQAHNGEVWIPHNAMHKVERYDRDGKKLFSFGKTDRAKADGFGGCCEPKNLRFGPKDEIYASESGPPVAIKRFTPEGKFLGVVGVPVYTTGCVRVTVEVSRDGRQVFILSPGENAIHVLTAGAAKAEKKADAEKKPESKEDSGAYSPPAT
jgi:hypothetical protein